MEEQALAFAEAVKGLAPAAWDALVWDQRIEGGVTALFSALILAYVVTIGGKAFRYTKERNEVDDAFPFFVLLSIVGVAMLALIGMGIDTVLTAEGEVIWLLFKSVGG